MIDALLKYSLIGAAAWLAVGAAAGIEDEYQKHAAAIWCRPGDVLVYIWDEDIYGRPTKKAMRACRPDVQNSKIFYQDEDGMVRRAK